MSKEILTELTEVDKPDYFWISSTEKLTMIVVNTGVSNSKRYYTSCYTWYTKDELIKLLTPVVPED
jgi:hypothetical protein